jgi:hypothetical protein
MLNNPPGSCHPRTRKREPTNPFRIIPLKKQKLTGKRWCIRVNGQHDRHLLWRECGERGRRWIELAAVPRTDFITRRPVFSLLTDTCMLRAVRACSSRVGRGFVARGLAGWTRVTVHQVETPKKRLPLVTSAGKEVAVHMPSQETEMPKPTLRTASGSAFKFKWIPAAAVSSGSWFHQEVSPLLQAAWRHARDCLLPRRVVARTTPEPMVLYHGTSAAAAKSIVKQRRLLPSATGMLGSGVYMGSFWKAARFATWDAHYTPRVEGWVVMALAFVDPSAVKIIGTKKDALCAKRDFPKVPPGRVYHCTSSSGVVKNEEWCAAPNVVAVRHCAKLDATTVNADKHDPLARTARIC